MREADQHCVNTVREDGVFKCVPFKRFFSYVGILYNERPLYNTWRVTQFNVITFYCPRMKISMPKYS